MKFVRSRIHNSIFRLFSVSLVCGLSLTVASCGKKKKDKDEENGGGGNNGANGTNGNNGTVTQPGGNSVDIALYGEDGSAVIQSSKLTFGDLTANRGSLRFSELTASDIDAASDVAASVIFPSQPQTKESSFGMALKGIKGSQQLFSAIQEDNCKSRQVISEAKGDTFVNEIQLDSSKDCKEKVNFTFLLNATQVVRCFGADFTAYKGKMMTDDMFDTAVTGCEGDKGFGLGYSVMRIIIAPSETPGVFMINQFAKEERGISEPTCMGELVQENPEMVYDSKQPCSSTVYIRDFQGKASDFSSKATETLLKGDSTQRFVGALSGANNRRSNVFFAGQLNLELNGWKGALDYEAMPDYTVAEIEMVKGEDKTTLVSTIDQLGTN